MIIRSMTRIPFRPARRAFAILAVAAAAALLDIPRARAERKSNAAAPLSSEQWAKILRRMEQEGRTRVLPFKVAEHLELTKGAETLTVRELAFEREGYQHGVYRSLNPNDDRIILAF